MKLRDFYYTVCDFEKNEVFSCGATFLDFMKFIGDKPENILLLKSLFGDGQWNDEIRLDYVDSDNMINLINDDVYSYGDFCWVDYKDFSKIENISKMELAELLYLGHMFQPLYEANMKWLDNKYVYTAHDDDFYSRVFMEDINEYKSVIHGKILDALKGRKKHIEPLPEDLIDYIFEHSQDGILFDFEGISFYDGKTYLDIYKLGKNYNYDEIYDVLKRKKWFTNVSVYLEYNSRNKKWKIYGDWK